MKKREFVLFLEHEGNKTQKAQIADGRKKLRVLYLGVLGRDGLLIKSHDFSFS